MAYNPFDTLDRLQSDLELSYQDIAAKALEFIEETDNVPEFREFLNRSTASDRKRVDLEEPWLPGIRMTPPKIGPTRNRSPINIIEVQQLPALTGVHYYNDDAAADAKNEAEADAQVDDDHPETQEKLT